MRPTNATHNTAIVGEVPSGAEMAASPQHVQPCVEEGRRMGNEPGTYARLSA